MRVLFIGSMYAPYIGGGAELVLQNQAESLAARGHDVHVLTLGLPGTPREDTRSNGVAIVRVPIRNIYFQGDRQQHGALSKLAWHALDCYNPAAAGVAERLVRETAPDVVVCHNVPGWSGAVWPALESTGVPVVQVLHDQYVRCIRSNMFKHDVCGTPCASCTVMRLPHRRLTQGLGAVVGVSDYILRTLVDDGFFADARIKTAIRNVSHLDTRDLATPPLAGAEVVFGFIGSINPSKGVEALLEAFLATAQPHWRLRVAGTGDPDYVDALAKRHADPRIEFLGRQEPSGFYRGIDVCVTPSLWNDTLPSVVFESLIHGRPVIGATRGGIPEMVQDGENGILFDPASGGSLARALQAFASDVAHWRARSAAIKSAATALYCDRERWIRDWEALLVRVIGPARAHAPATAASH